MFYGDCVKKYLALVKILDTEFARVEEDGGREGQQEIGRERA